MRSMCSIFRTIEARRTVPRASRVAAWGLGWREREWGGVVGGSVEEGGEAWRSARCAQAAQPTICTALR